MSIEIVCKRCGEPFAVDVKQTPGQWWKCPVCLTEELPREGDGDEAEDDGAGPPT
jgi:hypothetical protein